MAEFRQNESYEYIQNRRFVESEHKRDERGRFVKMGTSELKAAAMIELENYSNLQPEKAYGFADNERMNTSHHVAHAKEMGFKNQSDYEKAAVSFFNGDEGELYYSERRERFYRYDKKSKRMVVSSDGVIHTFMIVSNKKFETKQREDKLWMI